MNSIVPRRILCKRSLSIGICLLLAGTVCADEDAGSSHDNGPSKSKTTKIPGVIEAVKSAEIAADTRQIESFRIKRLVPHGKQVSEGQGLVWFETKEIDKQIQAAELEQRLAKLKLRDAEFSHQQLLRTQTLDKTAAEQTRKHARQDYDNFVQVDRERQRLTAEFNLKFSRAALENATEELEQLEQMYQEDDLTEQSEEIVLKRARRAVESAQFRLDGTEIQTARTIDQEIPRSTEKQEAALARARLDYQTSTRQLESARRQSEIELTRARRKLQEQEELLTDLQQERKRMVLVSPIDGIVLHGRLDRGKLSEKPSLLKAGSKVTASQIVATVVNPGKLRIRVDLQEQYRAVVTPGTRCKVKVTGFPDLETTGKVKAVSSIPYAGTKYDCVVALRHTKQQPPILPMMSCELEFESAAAGGEEEPTEAQAKPDQAADGQDEEQE